jgi:hypothetical protein
MSTQIAGRRTAGLIVSGALLLLATFAAGPPQANASKIYACVKKNGTARFVKKSTKCKKGESKLSWNSEGPAGPAGKGLQGIPGAEGKTGSEGKIGPEGKPGARAYAYMTTPGAASCELLPAETKNFIACSRPATGIYCLTPAAGINPTNSLAFVTVEWGRSSGSLLAAFVEDAGMDGTTDACGAARFEVHTYDFAGKPSDSVAFYILVV